jgi:hypothetical protein
MNHKGICGTILLAAGLAGFAAHAALPALTPAQQQAAADKKAKDAAQAVKDKQSLSDSMDAIAAHYRVRAKAEGWTTHPAVAIAAAAPAAAGPGGITTAATNEGPAGQPNGKLTQAGANAPKTSEKFGTAAPSADVKAHLTPTLPAGTPPTVQKGTPKVKNQ